MSLAAGNADAYAHLDVANPLERPASSCRSRRTEPRSAPSRFAASAQDGTFSIPAATDFAEGDRYALRVTSSPNAVPSGLSVTLPFVRTDI